MNPSLVQATPFCFHVAISPLLVLNSAGISLSSSDFFDIERKIPLGIHNEDNVNYIKIIILSNEEFQLSRVFREIFFIAFCRRFREIIFSTFLSYFYCNCLMSAALILDISSIRHDILTLRLQLLIVFWCGIFISGGKRDNYCNSQK